MTKKTELTLFEREELDLGDDIFIKILEAKEGRVTIGIDAPDDVRIIRGEKK